MQPVNHHVFCFFQPFVIVYVFPEPPVEEGGRPKEQWTGIKEIQCGWAKKWDPPMLPECTDPRGCPPPPPRNDRIWGSFEDDWEKNLDVGAVYWYACRKGVFQYIDETIVEFIDLTCINDPSGGKPYWDPPYEHGTVPFPNCVILREYLDTTYYQSIHGSWLYCI